MPFKFNQRGFVEIMNGPGVERYLDIKATEAVDIAKATFEAREKHQGVHFPGYNNSWFIRKVKNAKGSARRIGNSDPRWVWVEFGAHAGGKTPVLNYRILGTTLDAIAGGK